MRRYPGELRTVGLILAALILFALVLIIQRLGDLVMRKSLLILAAVTLAALPLGGCGTMGGLSGGTGNADVIGTLREIASDPRCAHTDRVSGNLGGLGGNNLNVFLERTCPAGEPAPKPIQ